MQKTVTQASATTIKLDPPATSWGTTRVRVTAGAAAAGVRHVVDPNATPSATLATLSADGRTLTFEAGVTGAVVDYVPYPAPDLTLNLPPTTGIG